MNRLAAIPAPEDARALDTDALARLVGHIYRGVEDHQGMRDFLAGCTAELRAFSGSILLVDPAGRIPNYFSTYPHSGAAVASYMERFQDGDPILAAMLKAESRRAYLLDEIIDPVQKATHRYFTEWAVHNDVGDMLTCRVPCGSSMELMAGFLRSRSAPPFGEAEREMLELLLPHMELANQLHLKLDRLSVFADIAQEQLFQAMQGLAVLDEDGRLLFTNPLANRLLRQSGAFRFDAGVPLPCDPADASRFVALRQRCAGVAAATDERQSATALRLQGGHEGGLLVTVLPYIASNPRRVFRDYAARVLLVMSQDPPERIDTRAQLSKIFDLTAVEADVFWRIGNGESVEEIAASSKQSTETVRSRLKRIFAKTGVGRQSDLVRLAVQGAPGWSNPGVVVP